MKVRVQGTGMEKFLKKIFPRVQVIAFILIITMSLSGCAELQKKFIRKKKPVEPKPRYERIQKYTVVPSIELYTKHYVYWRSWHRELMDVLGENIKKNKRCISEMVSNLEDMESMLVDEKAQELDMHIEVMRNIKNEIDRGGLTLATKTRIRRALETEAMEIKINFSYRKMEPYIRSAFRQKETATH